MAHSSPIRSTRGERSQNRSRTVAAAVETSPSLPPSRVVALVDIDAFECQVWQRMYPQKNYWELPCIVTDKDGRIVSATSEAKALGISRDIRRREAEKIAYAAGVKLHTFTKPNDREKPDGKSTRYASWEVMDAIYEYVSQYAVDVIVEYASSDEFYLDITKEVEVRLTAPNVFPAVFESRTYFEGEQRKLSGKQLKERADNLYVHTLGDLHIMDEKKLVYGAALMEELMNFIFTKTKFVGSVGIGTNKLMAKVGLSLNRPNGITILPDTSFPRISTDLLIEKIPGLGGKSGSRIKEVFKITTVKQLMEIELDALEELLDPEKALDIYLKCRGICEEPVKKKLHSQEISCTKTFINQITSDETLLYHLVCLAEEMEDRLGEEYIRHHREPTIIRASFQYSKRNQPEEFTWFSSIPSVRGKQASVLAQEIIDKIFKRIRSPISSLKITKVSLNAKQFQPVEM